MEFCLDFGIHHERAPGILIMFFMTSVSHIPTPQLCVNMFPTGTCRSGTSVCHGDRSIETMMDQLVDSQST